MNKLVTNDFNMSVILSYINLFLNVAASIIITPFIIRNLGTSEYGLYMLVYSVGMFLSVDGLGIGGVTVRYVKKYLLLGKQDELEKFLFTSLLIFAILGIVSFVILVGINFGAVMIFKNSIDLTNIGRFQVMLVITAINCVLMFFLNYLFSVITGYDKILFVRVVTLLKIIFRALFIIFMIKMIHIEVLVILDLMITALMILLSSHYAFMKLKARIKIHFFDKTLFLQTFKRISFVFVSLVTDNVCWNSGGLIVAMAFGEVPVGLFTLAMTLCGVFSQLSISVSALILPEVTGMVVKKASRNELLNRMIYIGRYMFILLALVIFGFAFIGKEFLTAYISDEFIVTYYISLPLMIALLYPSVQFAGDSIIQAMNKFNTRSAICMAESITAIILSFYLTPMLGIKYSWVGLVISTVIFRIFVRNYYYNRLGLNMLTFFKKTVPNMIMVTIIIVPILLLCFRMLDLHFICKGIIIIIVYSITVWFVYLNKGEKQFFINMMLSRGK